MNMICRDTIWTMHQRESANYGWAAENCRVKNPEKKNGSGEKNNPSSPLFFFNTLIYNLLNRLVNKAAASSRSDVCQNQMTSPICRKTCEHCLKIIQKQNVILRSGRKALLLPTGNAADPPLRGAIETLSGLIRSHWLTDNWCESRCRWSCLAAHWFEALPSVL